MEPLPPDKHKFIRELDDLGEEGVRQNLMHNRYDPPFRSLAEQWLSARNTSRLGEPLYRTPRIAELGRDIFVVHGHDEAAKEKLARFIEKLGLKAIILHEQPNAGRTIIEKFEDYSNVGFSVILLTPDDIGAPKDKPNPLRSRARQNVILELGYFLGKLGRNKVCALYKGEVEIPSDYQGVLYIEMDPSGGWRMTLAREIKDSGIEVDLDKAV